EAGNTGLITGGTLNKALEGKADKTYVDGELNKKADKSDITNLTNNITNKANISLNNIDKAGETVIKNLAKGSIKVANGTNTTVSEETEGDTKVYKVNVSNETIKNAIKSDLDNKADKSDLDKKADKDAGNIEISKWQTKLGNGKNEAGNTGLITGGTLNKALEDVKAGKADLNGEISADNKTKGVTGDKIYYAINNMTTVLENRGQARYNVLDNKINETGAESAALAALKYDNEDAKIQLAAGVGNYNGKTAYALGFKYNINNNASFHVGSTLGDGKTMINGGFSIAFGKGNKKIDVNMEKRIENMEKEINQLKQQNKELMKVIETLLLNKNKKSEFKDVPEGHWAKEAVDVLKGNGVLEGYPDGEFKGDRTMTRYEYSQMLEKALTKK
uniref:YadA-like family protein n=1 Tax=Dialister micraerophilus TaxID=309120 RepID=UPI0023F4B477